MRCGKCGSEWQSKINITVCPFCGELPNELPDNADMASVLKYIIDNYGADVYNDPKRILAFVGDLAPLLVSEKRLLKICIDSGVFGNIIKNSDLPEEQRPAFINNAVEVLYNDSFLRENAAKTAIQWLLYALDWHNEIPGFSETDEINPALSEYVQDKEKQKKRTVSKRTPSTVKATAYAGMIGIQEDAITALKSDGTVLVTDNVTDGALNEWCDIIAVSAQKKFTVGLKNDGTVVASKEANGRFNIREWTDIVSITSGAWHTVGVKRDGHVVAVGYNGDGQCSVSDWQNVCSCAASAWHTVGLKNNGAVVATGANTLGQCNVTSWSNIAAVFAGQAHTIGLKQDGTAVAAGRNDFGQCNIKSWKEITFIAVGAQHTVGLCKDGTVVAAGKNDSGECEISDWRNIKSITAGASHTVGLTKKGQVKATGDNSCGQCNVAGWSNIIAIFAGTHVTVGIKKDGTVVTAGKKENASDVYITAGWKLF